MKYLLIDKTESESYVELPDGRIVSIPIYTTSNANSDEFIKFSMNNYTENLHNNSLHTKNTFDFF